MTVLGHESLEESLSYTHVKLQGVAGLEGSLGPLDVEKTTPAENLLLLAKAAMEEMEEIRMGVVTAEAVVGVMVATVVMAAAVVARCGGARSPSRISQRSRR